MSLRPSFIPVFASEEGGELGNNSMLIGGSTMYLSPDEAWPTCVTCSEPLVPLVQMNVSSEGTPDAFRALIPSVAPAGSSLATMVQLFVCRDHDCYEEATMDMDARSWNVRLATVPLVPPPSNAPHLLEARTEIENGEGFLPAQLVETWTAGKEETWHWERMMGDASDEFYCAPRARRGDETAWPLGPRQIQLCTGRRELIQLGDRDCWQENRPFGIMGLDGNIWIDTLVDPEVLTLGMSVTY
ncbi:hypothetical protein B0H14DRAFT_956089 [Mycena olivaceomarginata]|nr:hypothetical protein B0H14DRAFT_956089 [Mycena olivaceomarginata]